MPTPSVYYQTQHDLDRARDALEEIDAELDRQVYGQTASEAEPSNTV